MQQQLIEIPNKLGLHARASAKLAQLASQFQSEVFVGKNCTKVNAKSIMGLMMLAAGKGTTIFIETDGADEEEALKKIIELIEDKFGEGS